MYNGIVAGLVVLLSVLAFRYLFFGHPTIDTLLHDVGIGEKLDVHRREMFKPEVIRVTDGIYVAVGYALANSIMLEGKDGLVIVDTTENVKAAEEIHLAFRNISSKPIKAIVYTHNHADHTGGARAFIEDPINPPEIWAHYTLIEKSMETLVVGKRIFRGATHQFGTALDSYLADCGIGPGLMIDKNVAKLAPLPPTKLVYDDDKNVLIAGLNITFIHIPGETPDQIGIWLPEIKVLLPADDIYKTFPNLYAIRGTPPRHTMIWANSLKKMRKLGALYMVPSHTLPVYGKEVINNLLTAYISGIQYVNDQTVRHINFGLHPDEISKIIRLPSTLASHPYLQEFYGKTRWSSKGVYENYLGWFSGDPVELLPFTPLEKSQRMVDLVGARGLLKAAEQALNNGDNQWALELSSFVFRVQSGNDKAKQLRLKALKNLAGKENNPLARNYYLTAALDDFGLVDFEVDRKPIIKTASIGHLFEFMKYNVNSEKVDGVNTTLIFNFTDINEVYRLQIVHSVLDVEHIYENDDVDCDALLKTTSIVWRELVSRERSPAMAYLSSDIQIDGSLFTFRRFMSYFDKNT